MDVPQIKNNLYLLEEKKSKLLRHVNFINLDQENLSLVLETIELSIELKEWDICKGIISNALVLFPKSAALNSHAGYMFMVLGDCQQAASYFNTAINLGEVSPIVYFNLAQTYLLLGQIDLSAKTLSACPDIEQQLPAEFLLLSARLNHHLDNFEKAIAQLTTLHATYKTTPESAGLLSLILFEEGKDYELAQKLADDALTKNPLALEALLARTSLNLHSGHYDQAFMDIGRAVHQYPTNGRAWSSLALVEFNNLAFEAASNAAQKAVEFMPEHIGTWHLLGWAYVMQSKFELALDAFKESYDLDRRFASTHAGLAAAYAHLGETKLANNHIKLADKLNPNGLPAMYAKMVLLTSENKHAEANALFENSKLHTNENGASMQQLIDKRLFELAAAQAKPSIVH